MAALAFSKATAVLPALHATSASRTNVAAFVSPADRAACTPWLRGAWVVLAARGLEVLAARGPKVLAAWRLEVLTARGLEVLAAWRQICWHPGGIGGCTVSTAICGGTPTRLCQPHPASSDCSMRSLPIQLGSSGGRHRSETECGTSSPRSWNTRALAYRVLPGDPRREWSGQDEGGGPEEPARRHRPDSGGRAHGRFAWRTRDGDTSEGRRRVTRSDRLCHPRRHGYHLKRQGRAHSLWTNPTTGAVEAVPRH